MTNSHKLKIVKELIKFILIKEYDDMVFLKNGTARFTFLDIDIPNNDQYKNFQIVFKDVKDWEDVKAFGNRLSSQMVSLEVFN